MPHHIFRLMFCLLLLSFIPAKASAEIIHWQLSGTDISSVFSGGFDFNTETQAVSNITVKSTSNDPYCLACHDFTDSGTGMPLPYNTSIGIKFVDELRTGGELEERYTLYAVGGNNLTFNINIPGTYTDLFVDHTGWIKLHNPYDPDIFDDLNCICGTADGTIVPVPEPSTYALMLAGIGMIGWRMKSSGREDRMAWLLAFEDARMNAG